MTATALPGTMVANEWSETELPADVEPLRRRIVAGALRVHRHLGPGFRENVYQRCLVHTLKREGLRVREERWLGVEFEGLLIPNAARPDLVIEERIIVELKSTPKLHRLDIGQLVSYLRASGLPLGLIFNFHSLLLMKGGYERVVHPRFLTHRSPEHGSPGSRVLGWGSSIEQGR